MSAGSGAHYPLVLTALTVASVQAAASVVALADPAPTGPAQGPAALAWHAQRLQRAVGVAQAVTGNIGADGGRETYVRALLDVSAKALLAVQAVERG